MTFYLQTYPQTRPYRRLVSRWAENREQPLNVNIREEDEAYILSALVAGFTCRRLEYSGAEKCRQH